MKKNIKYILGILLSSVLVVTGCGSSSSNNPVGNGTVSSGLVSVNGNVKNSNGNGTVSFYTPTAIYGTSLDANNLRTSVANNEVYTFNIDENGNYAGQIPAGDYYVIAQNSDGSMKYASARQSFVTSARAVTDPIPQTVDIKLVPTITISGILQTSSDSVSGQYVYIENMPFVTTTSSDGSYTLSDVPLNDEYTICSNIWFGDTRYRFVNELNKEVIDKYLEQNPKKIENIRLCNLYPISLDGQKLDSVSINIDYNKFLSSSDGLTINNIMAITDNKVYSAIPNYSSMFKNDTVGPIPYIYILPIKNTTNVKMLVIKTGDTESDSIILNEFVKSEDGKTITISEIAN